MFLPWRKYDKLVGGWQQARTASVIILFYRLSLLIMHGGIWKAIKASIVLNEFESYWIFDCKYPICLYETYQMESLQ